MRSYKRLFITALIGLTSFTTAQAGPKVSSGAAAEATKGSSTEVNVLIDTSNKNYSKIITRIEAMGGSVGRTFKYVDGLSATIPASAFADLSDMQNVEKISLDSLRYPGPEGGYDMQTAGKGAALEGRTDTDASVAANKGFSLNDAKVQALPAGELQTYYSYFPDSMNTAPVFVGGDDGTGSLVVIIDSGVYADHVLLAGKVIGGVDLSIDVGTALEGATHVNNGGHGTHVGGIVAGTGAIFLANDDPWVTSFEYYSGYTLPSVDADTKALPLLGTAPGAELYAVKVFSAKGGGAPTSTIIAGIEHAIDLKTSGTLDVDVINMSIGGGTGFEGRDLESQAVDAATAADITVVVSAGNDGPASQTIGSPAGAHTAITTGAVSHPVNTRFFWDFNYGFVGAGDLLTVDDNPQMAYFSSRGNTSDGREKPTASASGVFILSSYTGSPTALAFLSGTSMSSPAMAGIVALLNGYSEANTMGGSPYDYKQAVVAGSNLLAGYDAYEQGAGYIDAEAALAAFAADSQYGTMHPNMKKGYSAKAKKPYGTQLEDINEDGGQTFTLSNLKPGYVEDFYFKLHPNAERIRINVTDVELGVDPILFNSFEVHLMSGMRTIDGGYYFASTNVYGDAELSLGSMHRDASGAVYGVGGSDLPLMPGNIRLSIENDWTSFDNISGTFTVTVEHGDQSDKADETYSGVLSNHESEGYFPVGFGPNGVDLELSWKHDWTSYPTVDLDMIVVWLDTSGEPHFMFNGASFNSPELVDLGSTDIAAVFVLIDGFETYGEDEPWTLEVRHK